MKECSFGIRHTRAIADYAGWHNDGSFRSDQAKREQLCEIRIGHRLRVSDDKIVCLLCEAEWHDMNL